MTRGVRGSRKLNSFCISRMTVMQERKGKVSVRYIRTHTNHTPGIKDIKHLPLPKTVRKEIQEKYGQNIKLDSIIDSRCTHTLIT